MSKLVINTQHKENYGAHDWDGEGECPQYWKFKGGNTYVVRDLTAAHINKISEQGIPGLTALIESSDHYFEEYILDWEIVEDSAPECAEWDSAIEFQWNIDRWCCVRVSENGEYGHMRQGIVRQLEQWIPLEGGERSDYSARFDMADGANIAYSELGAWFDAREAA
jgi:hypothetical protein